PKFGPPSAPGEVGTLGPYRIVKQLGAGGMGAVYLAVDSRLDRKLALKVMLPEFAADRDAKERFLREAKAAAKISHDNVVTVFEADERDGVPYIAMQFLQGYPLDEYLKQKGRAGASARHPHRPRDRAGPRGRGDQGRRARAQARRRGVEEQRRSASATTRRRTMT
ncbi:MAG: protein kinase, partial [Gammaproteobacteria bacterium]|nr:protein kinase [Gammaproteobacteria bacterium]